MYHYWCGFLDHIHKMYMVAVTLPSYPAFRPMFVINILIYKIPKQFSEICGNLRHYLQIVFILVLIKHICLAAICKWCFCIKKVFFVFFYQSWNSSFINNMTKFWPSKFRYFKFHHLFSSFRKCYSWALAMLFFLYLIFSIYDLLTTQEMACCASFQSESPGRLLPVSPTFTIWQINGNSWIEIRFRVSQLPRRSLEIAFETICRRFPLGFTVFTCIHLQDGP